MGLNQVWSSLREFLPAYFLLLTPPVVMQEVTVYLFTHGYIDLYFTFSGNRLPVFLASFLLAGYLLHRVTQSGGLKLFSVTAVILTFLVRYYFACDLFECYYLQDPLQLVRLGLLMAGLVVLGDSLGVWRQYGNTEALQRRGRQYLLAFSIIYVLSYFPLSTEFAGIVGIHGLGGVRLLHAFIVAPLISGMATLSLIQNRVRALGFYLASALIPILLFLTLPCDGCQTYTNILLVSPVGPIVAGLTATFAAPTISKAISHEHHAALNRHRFLRFLIIALLVLTLPATLVTAFRGATPETLDGIGTTGPTTTPYVGVYDAIPYVPACCVKATVIISISNQTILGTSNYLRAGIGVQAPNRYVDGLDYGYRLDVLLSSSGGTWIEANAWQTCDLNLACGGVPWQMHLYTNASRLNFTSGTLTLNLEIQMDSENRHALWYANGTTIGDFPLPQISLTSFSTGVLTFGGPTWFNFPYGEADFLQFGIESAQPIRQNGWTVTIMNPSYEINGSWVTLPHASVIQGPAAFWKVLWVWGGQSYNGVSVATIVNPTLGFRFSYTGTTSPDHQILW